MAAECRRPGARTLTRAGEVVAIEDADLLAGLAIGDAVDADVRMPGGDGAGDLLEVETVQLARRPIGRVDDVVEREVRFDLFLGEVVAVLPPLLLLVAIVPRLESDVVAELVGDTVGRASGRERGWQ